VIQGLVRSVTSPGGLSVAQYFSFLNRLRRRSPDWRQLLKVDRPRSPRPERLGILGIMKNESHLIDEWLEHCFFIGADRVFLIDNGSTDDTVAKLDRWLRGGRVELVIYPEQHQQQRHYWNAFTQFGIRDRCDWLAIADIDEFWLCKSDETLASYLDRQTGYDALYVNWSMFGSSGLDAQPKSVRASLVMKDPKLARQTKCIFRTFLPVREDDIEVHNIRNARPWRVKLANRDVQLNHYATQSREFWFNVKLKRGDVFYTEMNMAEMAARFDRINRAATTRCTRLRDRVCANTGD
jgi:Glycosyl transferase family 2